jgi:monofunctional biosynthetic peptidoglycan transglycosylase
MAKKKATGKKPTKKKAKKGNIFVRLLRGVLWIFIALFASTIVITVAYKFINPPVTPLMIIRVVQQVQKGQPVTLKKDWTDIEDISPNMTRAVIAAEDNLFMRHNGFDTKAIERAIEHNKQGKKVRGGSTISQQTAKNVFLWPDRSYLRKGLEVYFTFLIETVWGKKRIMEVYLNVIETGNGIYGVEKAAQIYYSRNSKSLTMGQAAMIAALLPSPLKYSATAPGPYMLSRQSQLIDLMPKIETIKIEE